MLGVLTQGQGHGGSRALWDPWRERHDRRLCVDPAALCAAHTSVRTPTHMQAHADTAMARGRVHTGAEAKLTQQWDLEGGRGECRCVTEEGNGIVGKVTGQWGDTTGGKVLRE